MKLELAYLHQKALKKIYAESVTKPKFKFYNAGGYRSYDIDIKDNEWDVIQYVVLNDTYDIIGYLCAYIDRPINNICNLFILNFSDDIMSFSIALLKFFKLISGYRKISWTVIIGNPIEKKYDRFASKIGASIVGIKRKDVFIDGGYYDIKLYEWLKGK